jgi:hypothetical protein
MEKVQKLEAELERAAAQRHSYEEKGRRYQDAMEEVRLHRVWGSCASLHGGDEPVCEHFLPRALPLTSRTRGSAF